MYNSKKKIETMEKLRKVCEVDDFFELDRYQILLLLFNEMLIYTMLSNVVFNIFGAAQPHILGCDNVIYNGTLNGICEQFEQHFNCVQPQLQYDFLSAATEFNQLCSRRDPTWLDGILEPMGIKNKPKFSTTVQMVGLILGSGVAGHFSDNYGRKKVTMMALIFMFICSLGSSFSPSIDVYVVVRFFIGLGCGGSITVGTIFVVEMLPANHRLWMSTVITWGPNYLIFALIAYLTGTWRGLARAGSVVTAGAIIICGFFLPESPKFLVQKKREADAVEALEYVNRFKKEENKISSTQIRSIVRTACEASGDMNKKAKKYTFLHLYSTKDLVKKTIVISIGLFSLSYMTTGLIFNLDIIKGSIYLNTAFSGLLQWIVGAVVAVVDHFGKDFVSRKRLHFTTMTTILVCMISTFVIQFTGNQLEYANFVRFFTLVAFGTTGCLFLQCLLVTSELFPTGVRNLASAHINVCGRLGNVFGPMVFSLAVPMDGFPYLLMSLLCLTDILLYLFFIPETKGHALPHEMPVRKSKLKKDLATEELLVKA